MHVHICFINACATISNLIRDVGQDTGQPCLAGSGAVLGAHDLPLRARETGYILHVLVVNIYVRISIETHVRVCMSVCVYACACVCRAGRAAARCVHFLAALIQA